MKKVKIMITLCICFLLAYPQTASAAAKAVVSLKAGEIRQGDDQVAVTCEISSSVQMTNGKIRVIYDSSQLTLISAKEGQAIGNTAPVINDPVTGTKEEGEIVLAFANATEVDANGSLLDMVFRLDSTVKAGDQIVMDVKVEQLAADSADLEAEAVALDVTVGAGNPQSEPESGTESGTEKQKKQTDSNTNSPGTNGNPGTGGNNGSSGTNGTSGNSGGTSASDQVKTGDDTGLLMPVLVMGAAVAAFTLAVYRKKIKSR